MRTIILLLLLLAPAIFTQERDIRAELNTMGSINNLSLSPNGNLWLVTKMKEVCFAKDIYSNWNYKDTLFVSDCSSNFDRISFFDENNAILSGDISYFPDSLSSNAVYITNDKGKSWEKVNFGDNSWIYDICTNKYGEAWMGGSSGNMFYSSDHGKNWNKLNSPFSESTRMCSISMTDHNNGISGALYNSIYKTIDNWKTFSKISTPFEQKKYTTQKSNNRINKVRYWNNYIIVNQANHIFYTDKKNIRWKKFPVKLIDFEIDKSTNELFAISNDLFIYVFSSPSEYYKLNDQQISETPIDMKVLDTSVYILDISKKIYKINKREFYQTHLYTVDHKIPEPRTKVKSKNTTWSINGRNLYIYDNGEKEWYREYVFPFDATKITPIDDNKILVWNDKNNYLYDRETKNFGIYRPTLVINEFLKFPINKIDISSAGGGCFGGGANQIVYTNRSNTDLESESINEYKDLLTNGTWKEDSTKNDFKNIVSLSKIDSTLHVINSDPYYVSMYTDFGITQKDIKGTIQAIGSILRSYYPAPTYQPAKKLIISKLMNFGKINTRVVRDVLFAEEKYTSTGISSFDVNIINNNNDTLNISRKYSVASNPWHLPWKITYHGIDFLCYNYKLSLLIKELIPKNFRASEYFDNKFLIFRMADYTLDKEQEQGE
jgi:hypothetical protein